MADTLPVSPVAPQPNHQARAGYRTGKEVEFHARVMEFSESPEFKRAMHKLDKVTRGETPLRDDVPRGYYLNIQI